MLVWFMLMFLLDTLLFRQFGRLLRIGQIMCLHYHIFNCLTLFLTATVILLFILQFFLVTWHPIWIILVVFAANEFLLQLHLKFPDSLLYVVHALLFIFWRLLFFLRLALQNVRVVRLFGAVGFAGRVWFLLFVFMALGFLYLLLFNAVKPLVPAESMKLVPILLYHYFLIGTRFVFNRRVLFGATRPLLFLLSSPAHHQL
jgi:hypothetical protein